MVIPMNPIDSLAALRDIRVPDSPQFWPPAPGWLVVAGLIIAAGVTATVVGVRRWRATRFRREALAYLHALRTRHEAGESDVEIAMELSVLIRRVALARHHRHGVAGLTGEQWIAQLESTLPGIGVSARTALLVAPYARRSRFDVGRALSACEHWVRRA